MTERTSLAAATSRAEECSTPQLFMSGRGSSDTWVAICSCPWNHLACTFCTCTKSPCNNIVYLQSQISAGCNVKFRDPQRLKHSSRHKRCLHLSMFKYIIWCVPVIRLSLRLLFLFSCNSLTTSQISRSWVLMQIQQVEMAISPIITDIEQYGTQQVNLVQWLPSKPDGQSSDGMQLFIKVCMVNSCAKSSRFLKQSINS